MKTPREILLEKHESANAKLDLVRNHVLAQLPPQQRNKISATHGGWLAQFWREAVFPWRRFWIGMAAVWAVIMAMNAVTGEGKPKVEFAQVELNPQLKLALQEQRLLLAQLLEASEPPRNQKVPKPGPRSEWRGHEAIV